MTDELPWMSKAAVIQVSGARGFVVGQYVVTAAHCLLPNLPPPQPAQGPKELTYRNLLGPLHGECRVSAECVFIDLIEDLAVLGPPDSQMFGEEADKYETFLETVGKPFSVRDPRGEPMRDDAEIKSVFARHDNVPPDEVLRGWLISLEGQWFSTEIRRVDPFMSHRLFMDTVAIKVGMSGSPIVNDKGFAVGIVNVSYKPINGEGVAQSRETATSPMLFEALPERVLRKL